MADIRPFKAVRPSAALVSRVAALPYDVYSREEAALAVKGHELSFLNIDRPETLFPPEHYMYGDDVYEAARARYQDQKERGVYIQDQSLCYYIYELTMEGRSQTGVAAVTSVDDYLADICKKHENTTEEKERDRIHHIDTMNAQTGPIFLAYHADREINKLVDDWKISHMPVYDFVSEDGIGHRVWVINNQDIIEKLQSLFKRLDCTYIADGHHRAASAVKVALKRRKEAAATGREDPEADYNFFLSVLFPDDELKILDYNRVVKDLRGLKPEEFVQRLGHTFEVEKTGSISGVIPCGHMSTGHAPQKNSVSTSEELMERTAVGGKSPFVPADPVPAKGWDTHEGQKKNTSAYSEISSEEKDIISELESKLRPTQKYEIGMYLEGKAYKLQLRQDIALARATDPVKSLDVSVLQDEVLSKLLGIYDPRTDTRIKFVGGIRGIGGLIKEADTYTREARHAGTYQENGPAVAFVMYPTSIAELFKVADAGLLMPPKSTWFEPKLRSGIFIHEF